MNTEIQTAEYVLQHNAITRAIYNLSASAQKLIAMAMALIPMDAKELQDYRVEFTIKDFVDALKLSRIGTETEKYVLAAVRECLDSHIEIFLPNREWVGWTWFLESRLVYEDTKNIMRVEANTMNMPEHIPFIWDKITMTFNPCLGKVLNELKRHYTKINLADIGKLSSKYAIRFFNIAMSWQSEAGKKGNPPNTWYFAYTLPEIRSLFVIPKSKYPVTGNFRTKVIDHPLTEINNANLGIKITPEYIRKGRSLYGVKFWCKWTSVENERNVTPVTKTEQDTAKLRALYPEKWAEFKKEAPEKIPNFNNLFDTLERIELNSERYADGELGKYHTAQTKQKRERPRKARCENEGTPEFKKLVNEAYIAPIVQNMPEGAEKAALEYARAKIGEKRIKPRKPSKNEKT
jgi:hypothetical protein